MSVRPTRNSVGLTLEGFPWYLMQRTHEIKNSVKIEKNYRAPYIHEDLPF